MKRTKWTDRKFVFDIPEGWLPDIFERLVGTDLRIAELTKAISGNQPEFKSAGKWSIKEHIGHLSDLEELHAGRIDDFISRNEILRPADMDNLKTNEANHNMHDVQYLIRDFAVKRNQFIQRLKNLDDLTQQFKSMHPRLKIMMKPVDMAFFIAEHDDHHLAGMREIIMQF